MIQHIQAARQSAQKTFLPGILWSTVLLLGILFLCILNSCQVHQLSHPKEAYLPGHPKQLYLPKQIWMVPEGNDFKNPESEFAFERMKESANAAIFWSREFGSTPPGLNIEDVLKECERFYTFYTDSLRFLKPATHLSSSYKILIFVFKGKENTAFGGGEEQKVGILWTPLARISQMPYGALAHELGHSFQYLVNAGGSWAFTSSPEGNKGQPIFEMTSQYMLWNVYPQWMTFENYHVKDFLKNTHYAFLHEINQYHSPFVLEYWSEKHGLQFIGKLWREAIKGEDPVLAYQRITKISQQQFNEEIHQAARKFITWDMKRVKLAASPYANQHHTVFDTVGKGWYQVAKSNCPQNYGYNGIKLKVPANGTRIGLEFKGIAGKNGFRSVNIKNAGWRYSFLAVRENGMRVYGKIYSSPEGFASFSVPSNTRFLWLVVSGAPAAHWEHITDGKDDNDEQWPYQIKLTGTSLAER